MTDTTDTTDTTDLSAEQPAGTSAPPVAEIEAREAAGETIPFWQRPLVERYLVPFLLPVAVVVGIVFYVINVSRLFLSAHGHIPVIIGTVITVLILLGATLLSAGAERLKGSAIVLLTLGFVLSLTLGGWVSLGHSQNKEGGLTALPATTKATQTVAVTAAPGGALTFQPLSINVKPGLVKFNVTFAATGHTFGFHDSSTLFPELKDVSASAVGYFGAAGDFIYFCSIPGHEAAGMRGVVHVKGAPVTLEQAWTAAGNAGPPPK
jgi:plastocyanin